MTSAVDTFAFSRLPKKTRIALILRSVLGIHCTASDEYLETLSEEIAFYADHDFAVPYKEAKNTIDTTMEDIIS